MEYFWFARQSSLDLLDEVVNVDLLDDQKFSIC